MATTVVKKKTVRFDTQGGSPLVLTVTVGDGQAGGITVTFEDQIKDHPSGARKKIPATNNVYSGKRIVIDATVKDVQSHTDNTSVHVILEAGSGAGRFTASGGRSRGRGG